MMVTVVMREVRLRERDECDTIGESDLRRSGFDGAF